MERKYIYIAGTGLLLIGGTAYLAYKNRQSIANAAQMLKQETIEQINNATGMKKSVYMTFLVPKFSVNADKY